MCGLWVASLVLSGCKCQYKCGALFYIDPATRETRPGQLVKPSTRTKHRKRDRESGCSKLEDDEEEITRLKSPLDSPGAPSLKSPLVGLRRGAEMRGAFSLGLADLGEGKAVPVDDGTLEMEHVEESEALMELGSTIRTSVSALGSWLYLVAGLSRTSVGRTLSAVRSIVSMAIKFGELSARFKARWTDFEDLKAAPSLPRDVRTSMKDLGIEPIYLIPGSASGS
ncbi:hypothetical protein CPC08DRAFT_770199 [Agrocybe pediades]|nr:hypothetical protein CPC08DRAFT_770199 [Agrocybe pediades]